MSHLPSEQGTRTSSGLRMPDPFLAILTLVVGLMVSACATASVEVDNIAEAPTAVTSTTGPARPDGETTTTAAPIATASSVEQASQDVAPSVFIGDGKARFRSSVVDVPFSYVPAQGWVTEAERPPALVTRLDDITYLIFAVVSGSVQELTDSYAAASECYDADMGETTATAVGGFSGLTFEVLGPPKPPDDVCDVPIIDVDGRWLAGQGRGLFQVVDVRGTTVAIVYWTLPSVYDDHLDSVTAMLDSITWKDRE